MYEVTRYSAHVDNAGRLVSHKHSETLYSCDSVRQVRKLNYIAFGRMILNIWSPAESLSIVGSHKAH